MKTRLVVISLVVVLLSTAHFTVSKVNAATITEVKPGIPVRLTIPDTDLLVKGCVAPNSLVHITDNNTVVGTVTSDSAGVYSRLLAAQSPTIHKIETYFEDVENNKSSTVSSLVALAPKTFTTHIANPPPTVINHPQTVEAGKFISFQGYACPNTVVKLSIDGNTELTSDVDGNGYWSIDLNSINFISGLHTYSVKAVGNGFESGGSQKKQFRVVAPTNQSFEESPSEDLSVPVVILTPEDGYRAETNNVIVSGTGPINSQIEVYIDGVLVGSAFSNTFGNWSLAIKVLGSQQTIEARACNSSGCGEISKMVQVYNDNIIKSDDVNSCSLLVKLDKYRVSNLIAGKGLDLGIKLSGATDSRYDVVIDWGGLNINHQTTDDDSLKIHNVYKNTGHYNGTVSVANESGCQDTAYFSVEVVDRVQSNNTIKISVLLLALAASYVHFSRKALK